MDGMLFHDGIMMVVHGVVGCADLCVSEYMFAMVFVLVLAPKKDVIQSH